MQSALGNRYVSHSVDFTTDFICRLSVMICLAAIIFNIIMLKFLSFSHEKIRSIQRQAASHHLNELLKPFAFCYVLTITNPSKKMTRLDERLLFEKKYHYEITPIQIYRKFHLQIFFLDKYYGIFHISAQNIDCGTR